MTSTIVRSVSTINGTTHALGVPRVVDGPSYGSAYVRTACGRSVFPAVYHGHEAQRVDCRQCVRHVITQGPAIAPNQQEAHATVVERDDRGRATVVTLSAR